MTLSTNMKWFVGGAITAITASMIYMNLFIPISVAISTSGSERISWDESNTLRNEYSDAKFLKVKYQSPTTGADTIAELKGFVIDASQLDEIINHNRSSLGAPDEVIFYLGQNGSFRTGIWPFTTNHPNYQIIAAGVRNDTLLNDYGGSPTNASLFDKADPCPPNCPTHLSYP